MKRISLLSLGLMSLSIAMVMNVSAYRSYSIVAAATPMPTNVNMTNLIDAEVSTYYQGVEGKSGEQLLEALHHIIKDHNEYNYDSNTHRTIYKIIDRNYDLSPLTPAQISNFDYTNDNPFIKKLYADYNDDINTADRFRNDGASRVSFDKEHIWAQSLGNFGRTGGAGSDFHALWPSDVRGNQFAHSNFNFAEPTSGITNYDNDKGTYVGRNGFITGYAQKVFEPLDEFKGDIARAMLYMPARYYVYVDNLRPKLQLVNGSPNAVTASPTQPGLAGDLATLLQWNELDPVDEHEIRRNNLLYNNYQGNRNPFIDYPQWARIAYDTAYTGLGASRALGSSSVGDGVENPDPGEPDVTLERIEVSFEDATHQYFIFDTISKDDFIVTAFYSDDSFQEVDNYSLSIVGQDDLTLAKLGTNTVTISFSDGSLTKTATIEVEVSLSTIQVIIAGAISLVVIGVLIAVPSLRKFNKKNVKRVVKKTKSSSRKMMK